MLPSRRRSSRFRLYHNTQLDELTIDSQEEDWDQVRAKAQKLGATKMVIKDLRREFVEQFCFRAVSNGRFWSQHCC
jgi:argininosuccinate synthase